MRRRLAKERDQQIIWLGGRTATPRGVASRLLDDRAEPRRDCRRLDFALFALAKKRIGISSEDPQDTGEVVPDRRAVPDERFRCTSCRVATRCHQVCIRAARYEVLRQLPIPHCPANCRMVMPISALSIGKPATNRRFKTSNLQLYPATRHASPTTCWSLAS